jgi:hypothetical protein
MEGKTSGFVDGATAHFSNATRIAPMINDTGGVKSLRQDS